MAWMAAAAAVSALAGLGSAAINSSRSNGQAQQQSGLAANAQASAESNAQQQAMIQALINKRSTAGFQDSAGSSLRYDPTTNQWISALGKLPEQVQTSADQASVSRNTTDLRQAQDANAQSALRAARAGSYADTARRELENFRPMGHEQLIGLLGQQATNANNATYRPLVADTLRAFARTGTAAGPVLAQLGKGSADSLRDSLLDAQIKGMQGTEALNQSKRSVLGGAGIGNATSPSAVSEEELAKSKRSGLLNNAQTASGLATPAFGYSQITPSTYASTMANLANQRATTASTAPAYGAAAKNEAEKMVQGAYGTQIKQTVDPNYGIAQTQSGLDSLSTAFGKGGTGRELVNAIKSYTNADKPSTDYSWVSGMNKGFGSTDG
jgi:hypothetical protein